MLGNQLGIKRVLNVNIKGSFYAQLITRDCFSAMSQSEKSVIVQQEGGNVQKLHA